MEDPAGKRGRLPKIHIVKPSSSSRCTIRWLPREIRFFPLSSMLYEEFYVVLSVSFSWKQLLFQNRFSGCFFYRQKADEFSKSKCIFLK